MTPNTSSGQYALATGEEAVGRLNVLHRIYSPAGQTALVAAGLSEGMQVADFGCGPGMMTRILASMVGATGNVTGIDLHAAQLEQARELCAMEGWANTRFVTADACRTGLPRGQFDLVYCRFLLLHLTDPAACLREMWEVLKPGGILVVEDGDLASAASVPPTALCAFADLFGRLGPMRGVDYSVANRLWNLAADAGFTKLRLTIHQPADYVGLSGLLLKWSVREAGPAFVETGLITADELERTLEEMDRAMNDPDVLAMAPRMSILSGRKRVH
jgi:SAM-dependent methyltransferase